MTEREVLIEIRKARRWIHHYKQWRNEPSERKKLRRWQRRLRIAIRLAGELGLELPPDPYAPPPPPPPDPTPAELAAIERAAIRRDRLVLPWIAARGTTAWAPWGLTGWSAVRILSTARVWARVVRVDPRTEEERSRGNVRLERLVRRTPELRGRDRPGLTPPEIFDEYSSTPPADPAEPRPAPSPHDPERHERIARLMDLLDGDAWEEDDW